MIAEYNNKIIGSTDIILKVGRENHIGEFGIIVRKEYRGIGLGGYLMKEIIELAKQKIKLLKIIRLSVFAINKHVIGLYKKFGFKRVAKIPKQLKYQGKLIDEVVMLKEI